MKLKPLGDRLIVQAIEEEQTTASGLVIRTIEEGTGPVVKPVDGVLIEYEGRLLDGTVFDASAQHGGPAPLPVSGVIPGWSEGLVGMKVGGRRTLVIPAEQAYGPSPPPGSNIPPDAALVFTVDMVASS